MEHSTEENCPSSEIPCEEVDEMVDMVSKEQKSVEITTKNLSVEEQWAKALDEDDVKQLFTIFDQSKDRVKHKLMEIKHEYTGATAFHLACLHNHEEFVTDTLELDPFYRETEDENGNTGLHLACKAGHLNIVKALMGCVREPEKNYKYVNKRNDNGSSPLMFAAGFGHNEIVKYLVKRFDANPNMKNKKQQTALDLSKAKHHHDVSDYLGKAVQKKAIEDFTKIVVVVGGIPFICFIVYKLLQRF